MASLMKSCILAAVLPVAVCSADDLPLGGSVSGSLASDDAEADGKFQDTHTLMLEAGQAAQIELTSEDFDCYLVATPPGGAAAEDDDSAGDLDSRLLVIGSEAGPVEIVATSYGPGETGSYTLTAQEAQIARLVPGQTVTVAIEGAQAMYALPVTQGEMVKIDLGSDAFDTTLALTGPDGQRLFNDDSGSTLNSSLLYTPGATGDAMLTVAPYGSGASGEYTLSARALRVTGHQAFDGTRITRRTRLMPEVGLAATEVTADAGTRIVVEVNSQEFDPTLRVLDPAEGEIAFNDDAGEGTTNSRLTVTMPESGSVILAVEPYASGTGGAYELVLDGAGALMLPEFTLNDLDGNAVSSDQFAGHVRIVDVWATWCGPCRMEIPHFIELAQEYPDLRIIGISVDQEGPEVVREFAEENGVNYTMLMDDGPTTEALGALTEEGTIRGIPTTFIVGRDGRIAQIIVGYRDKEEFVREIEALMD